MKKTEIQMRHVYSFCLLAVGVIGANGRSPKIRLPERHDSPHKALLERIAQNPKIDLKKVANEFQILGDQPVVDEDDDYIVTAVSPTAINNDEVVTVSFQVLNDKQDDSDYIAAYSPADVDPTTSTPVKYGWCDRAETYMTEGTGSLTFNLTNLRSDVRFYYMTNGTRTPVVRSSGEELVSFKNPNAPLRPRIVPSGDVDIMWVLWSTATAMTPQLKYGTSSGVYDHVVEATFSSITEDDFCDAPARTVGYRETGLIIKAEMSGMRDLATQKVYYTFGDDGNEGGWADEHVFMAPPLAGQKSAPRGESNNKGTRVILYDDMGRGSTDQSYTWSEYGRASLWTEYAVGAEVEAGQVDAIYHGGDLSYATGYIAVWDFWLDQIAPFASGAIYLTNLGNHESDAPDSPTIFKGDDSGGECGVAATRFLPPPAPASTNEPWWSYDVGLIHFIGMSTEHNFTEGSPQWIFLDADLAAVDRSITPWVIFGGHRAMYINSNYKTGYSSDGEVMRMLIDEVEPLLIKYNVDLAFWGHNHAVQRQAAVEKEKVVQYSEKRVIDGETWWWHDKPGAPVHMVIGTAGADFTVNAEDPGPDWNELTFYEWGYAVVVAQDANELTWEWMNAREGIVMDRMRISK